MLTYPTKEYYTVNEAFYNWSDNPDINRFKSKRVIKALHNMLDYFIECGDNSPAYYADVTDSIRILHQLYYISDRWYCSGRIRFILRVIGE